MRGVDENAQNPTFLLLLVLVVFASHACVQPRYLVEDGGHKWLFEGTTTTSWMIGYFTTFRAAGLARSVD